MMSRFNIRNLKKQARCALVGRHASLAGVTILITVLNLALNMLASSAAPGGSSVFSILLSLLAGVLIDIVYYILLSGVFKIYLNLCRDNPYKWSDMFNAFKEHPEPVAIFAIVEYFLRFTLSQTLSLLTVSVFTLSLGGSVSLVVGSSVMALVVIVLYVYLQISLSMVLFVHADEPWLSFGELIHRGWNLMKGKRRGYLYMQLSFLGMYALEVCSLGIGTFFVQPYIRTTEGLFYRKISGR